MKKSPILQPKKLSKLKFDELRSIFDVGGISDASDELQISTGLTKKSTVKPNISRLSQKDSSNSCRIGAKIDVNFGSKSVEKRSIRLSTRLPLELNSDVSRVADQNRVVGLPNPMKESSLREDKKI